MRRGWSVELSPEEVAMIDRTGGLQQDIPGVMSPPFPDNRASRDEEVMDDMMSTLVRLSH